MSQFPYKDGGDTGFGPVEPPACILPQEQYHRQYDVDAETDEEDEMVTTERELAEDAQWKKIQQNTFTRWANEHLKTVSKHIGNLETDLSDGLRLISLIEVLANKQLPKHNKKPSFRSQKLENVSVALKFLQDDEGIRIVNIGKWCYVKFLGILCFTHSLIKPQISQTRFSICLKAGFVCNSLQRFNT